jgi:hypothetical protein
LKEKIGKFMERKEHKDGGKTSACQITSFISAMFYKIFTKKVYTYQMLLSSKTKKVFSKMIFLKQVKKYS